MAGLCIKFKGHRSYTIAEIRGLHKLLKLHGYTVTGVTITEVTGEQKLLGYRNFMLTEVARLQKLNSYKCYKRTEVLQKGHISHIRSTMHCDLRWQRWRIKGVPREVLFHQLSIKNAKTSSVHQPHSIDNRNFTIPLKSMIAFGRRKFH